MKPVYLAAPASVEFAEAVRWYETKRPGLGADFYDAVAKTIALIREHPGVGHRSGGSGDYRQLLVDRFPLQHRLPRTARRPLRDRRRHTKRRPGYWKDRG